MAYFIPTSIQKRLLRYALSRLELLDTDALDLEKLEIGWGRKSIVNLHDVSLRKDKLASLLDLPEHFSVVQAVVGRLRVTVPADLHTSSIVVEISHVKTRIRLEDDDGLTSGKRAGRNGKSSSNRSRSRRRKPLGSSRNHAGPDILPDTKDLAMSFLEGESAEEKAELQAAINASPVDLRSSLDSSDAGSDDSIPGLGMGFALPGFLASFLTGVGERLKPLIQDVSVKLDLWLDQSAEDPVHPSGKFPTTICLQIDDADVQSSTNPDSARLAGFGPLDDQDDATSQDSFTSTQRRLSLKGIHGYLTTDAALFAQVSQVFEETTGTSSPRTAAPFYSTLQPDVEDAFSSERSGNVPSPAESPPATSRSSIYADHRRDQSDTHGPSSSIPAVNQDVTPLLDVHRSRDLHDSDDGIAASSDALYDGDHEQTSSIDVYPSPSLRDSLTRFREERSRDRRTRSPIERTRRDLYSPPRQARKASPAASQLLASQQIPGMYRTQTIDQVDSPLSSPEASLNSPARIPSPVATPTDNDLAESQYFSHEEAQSIYMSAVRGRSESPSACRHMPGYWKETEDDMDQSRAYNRCNNEDSEQDAVANSMSVDKVASQYDPSKLINEDGGSTPPASIVDNSDSFCGPQATKREILSIPDVQICLSDLRLESLRPKPLTDDTPSIPKHQGSRSTDVPGSFSVYADSTTSIRASGVRNTNTPIQQYGRGPERCQRSVDITLGESKLHLDVGTTRLLAQLSLKLSSVMGHGLESEAHRSGKKSIEDPAIRSAVELKLHLRGIKIAFVEALKSTLSSMLGISDNIEAQIRPAESLLQLQLEDVSLCVPDMRAMARATIEVGKASFAIANQPVLHFSQNKALRTSISDLSEVRNKDFSIDYSRTESGATNIHVWIQPLFASLDIHRVDGMLDSIGGLSGLLEIGSSIMSDSTVIGRSQVLRPTARTVRFATPSGVVDGGSATTGVKYNVRLGGADISLMGETCSLSLRSSRMTAVARSGGMRLNIGEIRLEGPQHEEDSDRAPLLVSVHDTNLSYLSAPEERDLTRLIGLLTPSHNPFEEEDDFLVDTLMKQRKKGAVLRAHVSRIEVDCDDLSDVNRVQTLTQEMSKLSAVTKYLPEETRPGLLTIAFIDKVAIRINTASQLGEISLALSNTEVAHISAPALVAAAINEVLVQWGDDQTVISNLIPKAASDQSHMFMFRMIEDELEPNMKIKLQNTCIDYSVPLAIAIAELGSNDRDDSVIHLAEKTSFVAGHNELNGPSTCRKAYESGAKALRIDITCRDCSIGLLPRSMPSKALLMLNDTAFAIDMPDENLGFKADLNFRRAELLLIDDVTKVSSIADGGGRSSSAMGSTPTSRYLCAQGYVNVCSLSAALIDLNIIKDVTASESPSTIEVNFSNQLFLLETCADSTQTLIDTLGDLQPPSPPSAGEKYRTEIAPVSDLMASFIGDAYALPTRPDHVSKQHEEDMADAEREDEDDDGQLDDADFDAFDEATALEDDLRSDPGDDELEESIYGGLGLSELADIEAPGLIGPIRTTGMVAASPAQMHESILGSLSLAQLPPQIHGKAKRFDSRRNRYLAVSKVDTAKCPVKVHVKDTHIIWNMYDGYDWEHTRDTITQAVQDVEARAEEKRRSRRALVEDKGDDDESVIGDCLFNSIYIGVPISNDGKDLSRQINHDIDDLVSETASRTASNAPSHTTSSTSRPSSSHRPRTPGRRLKLDRSKRHKIAFELRGVSADFFAFPPGGETQSSTDIQIKDFEIFDHVPTSTWKKFLTYMHDAGPREEQKPMVHLEICDVRPVAELTASELVVRATLLPLRLHVDQDALDFITRFFGFKDSDKPVTDTPADQPFLQRVEIPSIPVKMDYKPHRVDFAGLRSGRTKEFMNFITLDSSDFILKHVCLYGVSGFDKLHEMLEDIWMADVKSPQQLPGVLSGINGVRTLVNMGTGMRDLVQIPIREYRKDGRIVRSISKGALAFGRTTGGELTRFGAKLAVGAQRALQGAEGVFLGADARYEHGWEEADLDPVERRAFSHYANQPVGILQGLKGAARSLERDLLVTRDVVIAISGEIRESGSVEGAARAVVRHAPTLILRPMIGASKAVGQTMMGATNTVDPANRRRLEDKYKRY